MDDRLLRRHRGSNIAYHSLHSDRLRTLKAALFYRSHSISFILTRLAQALPYTGKWEPSKPKSTCTHWFRDTTYALLLASAPKDALLFPSLRPLTWCDTRLTSVPALSLLLPTLETLSIDLASTPFRKANIPDLHTAAPRLNALEFSGYLEPTNLSEIESLLFRYPRGLTELSFRWCDISSNPLHLIVRSHAFDGSP
ncbi:uncharacterized protein EDB91DRAFT_1254845 [Suillus paluster]|uniref:uncharacterized protein n=1 Tax=Suillus paluster TaxID=48578 RepID=UPI001B8803C0|nr:uncharacterized protein EDB91DRAFT_1254845 [Suillus paluster]KAG1725258.1 hypothetical protein EDB91DRAFT_1254845 [Suillus paluster]